MVPAEKYEAKEFVIKDMDFGADGWGRVKD